MWEDAAGPGLVQPGEPMRSSIRGGQALHRSARSKDEGNDVKLKHRTELKTFFPMRTVRQWDSCQGWWFYSPHLQECSVSDWIKSSAAWCDHMATSVLSRGHFQPQWLCDWHESQGMLELALLWMTQIWKCVFYPQDHAVRMYYVSKWNTILSSPKNTWKRNTVVLHPFH